MLRLQTHSSSFKVQDGLEYLIEEAEATIRAAGEGESEFETDTMQLAD